ncbi:hypothetical protein ZWY2020_052938 [Hordeum vulgare]|nr:hypothetical protein ZWY2020_052938 [Hordeum vulgare]
MAPPQEGTMRAAGQQRLGVVVTVLLLLAVLGGGGCLVAYVVLPPSEAPGGSRRRSGARGSAMGVLARHGRLPVRHDALGRPRRGAGGRRRQHSLARLAGLVRRISLGSGSQSPSRRLPPSPPASEPPSAASPPVAAPPCPPASRWSPAASPAVEGLRSRRPDLDRGGRLPRLALGRQGVVVASTPDAARLFLRDHGGSFLDRPADDVAPMVLAYGAQDLVFAPYGPVAPLRVQPACSAPIVAQAQRRGGWPHGPHGPAGAGRGRGRGCQGVQGDGGRADDHGRAGEPRRFPLVGDEQLAG